MDASRALAQVLHDTLITKSRWCAASGVSRALLDDYLKGRKQPSVAQVDRLVSAAGGRAQLRVTAPPTPAPPALVDVLELGELFDRERPTPLPDISHVWRAHRHG